MMYITDLFNYKLTGRSFSGKCLKVSAYPTANADAILLFHLISRMLTFPLITKYIFYLVCRNIQQIVQVLTVIQPIILLLGYFNLIRSITSLCFLVISSTLGLVYSTLIYVLDQTNYSGNLL